MGIDDTSCGPRHFKISMIAAELKSHTLLLMSLSFTHYLITLIFAHIVNLIYNLITIFESEFAQQQTSKSV